MPVPATTDPLPAAVYEAIVDQVVDALVYSDREGLIRVWNRGAEALFGFAAHEALGASLDLIIPERLRAAHWAGFHRAIEAGSTRGGAQVRRTRAIHKDGRRLYVDMSFALVTDGDDEVIGSVAMARDATARQEEEAARRTAAQGAQGTAA